MKSLQILTQCLSKQRSVTTTTSLVLDDVSNAAGLDPCEEERSVTPLVPSQHEPQLSVGERGSKHFATPNSGCGLMGVIGLESEMDLLNMDFQHKLVQAEDECVLNVVHLT